MKLILLDTETNGFDFEDGQVDIVQLCYKEYKLDGMFNKYYLPSVPMKSSASAVNNIIDEMLVGCPRFEDESMEIKDIVSKEGSYIIAHNSKFDKRVLSQYMEVGNNFIDTLKIARYMYDLDYYSQQFLRYEWKVRVQGDAHNAKTDVLVLEKIFEILLTAYMSWKGRTLEESIADFVGITYYPALLRKFPFGEHRGKPIADVPDKYLDWVMSKFERNQDNEDVLYTVHMELERRKALK